MAYKQTGKIQSKHLIRFIAFQKEMLVWFNQSISLLKLMTLRITQNGWKYSNKNIINFRFFYKFNLDVQPIWKLEKCNKKLNRLWLISMKNVWVNSYCLTIYFICLKIFMMTKLSMMVKKKKNHVEMSRYQQKRN